MSKAQDRPARLADYVSTAKVLNGKPGEVIVRCRTDGCEWKAHAAHTRIGAELAYAHVYEEHGVRLERKNAAPPGRAMTIVGPGRIRLPR